MSTIVLMESLGVELVYVGYGGMRDFDLYISVFLCVCCGREVDRFCYL